MQAMKTVLSIAGTDPSGGAGLQADLKTFAAHGVYGMGVVTALVAQNTRGVQAVEKVSLRMLETQLESVFSDIFPDAVKTGMVPDGESIAVVASALRKWHPRNVVLDPVMVSTSAHRLLEAGAITALVQELFPLADLITPNIPEAEVLCAYAGYPDFRIRDRSDMVRAAKLIAGFCSASILLKGGHLGGASDDLLFSGKQAFWFEGTRIATKNTHGTGCTLSSAIASRLASGDSLPGAVEKAKTYITGALAAGLKLGSGNGPVDHCWQNGRAL
jgi:hydroxymethylpyrimidine kinase/phosphomethylpyrimidine kinase